MNGENDNLFETPKGVRILDEDLGGENQGPNPAAVASEFGVSDQDFDLQEGEQLLEGFDPEARVHRAGDGDKTVDLAIQDEPFTFHVGETITSAGAHFVYALIALTLTLGVLGLALTWQDGRVIAACAVIAPLSITWFCLRTRAWLNRTPYWYRLLTSLGENAENLSQFRLMRWARGALRALYS